MILSAILLLAAQGTVYDFHAPVPPPTPPVANLALPAVRSPQPRLPLLSLFSPDDYPAAASGRRGVVGLKLFIDPQGRLMTCGINRSSGEAALDVATCDILRRRSRFVPAVDERGGPTSGQVDVQVDWDAVFKRVRVIRGN